MPIMNPGRLTIWSGILLFFNFVVLFLLVLGFLAAYIPPDTYWPFAFAGLVFPYAVIANLFFVVIWMFLWRKLFLVSLIALLICWSRLTNYLQLSRNVDESKTEISGLKVISYNVQIFDLYNWGKSHISEKGYNILNVLKDEKPDLVCLQEYHAGRKSVIDISDSIKQINNLKYNHISFVNKDDKVMPYGIATYSRWPIINREVIIFEDNSVNFCIYSDIVVDEDTIRVFNVHLESIRLSKEDYLYVEELPKKTDTQEIFSENSKKILRKFKRAFITRAPQARKLNEVINESPFPVIVCGDFNDTPSSYTYHQLSNNLVDAFKESGKGIGMTYAGSLPSFRIDYILHDQAFTSVNYKTIRKNFSDHFPISTRIILDTKIQPQ